MKSDMTSVYCSMTENKIE